MIHVVATIELHPDRREEFLVAFAKLTPLVHAEDGCIEYGAAIDEATGLDVQQLVGDNTVVVIEKWESAAALQAHLVAPHMEFYREETANMVKRVSLQVLRPATD